MASAASVRLQKNAFAAPVARPLSQDALKRRAEDAPKMFWRPMDKRDLRSCLHCGIIQTSKEFRRIGCKNQCFDEKEAKARLELHTTKNYAGIISITEPFHPDYGRKSWVARYHRIDGVCGCYSLHRVGNRPRLVHGEFEFDEMELIPEEWQTNKMKGIKTGRSARGTRPNLQKQREEAQQRKAQDETMYGTAAPATEETPQEKKGDEDFGDLHSEVEDMDLGPVDDDFDL